MKYEKCEKCGAHLDHGERCDCEQEKELEALLVPAKGKIQRIRIKDSLAEWQKAVGGYIETVTMAVGVVLICNEEGKLLDLPVNEHLCQINGDFLLAGVQGDGFVSLTRKQMEQLERLFA